MSESDAQLVRNAISGDLSAFDELVSRYRSRVYHLALSKVRSRDAALDLAQDAFVQAFMSLGTLREPGKFGAWLAGITHNLSLMHLRRSREIPMPDEAFQMMTAPEPDAEMSLARDALDRLPNGSRSTAILYFVEEMKQTEIAEYLGISLPAVKSRIRDARTRVQKEMIDVVKRTSKKGEPGDEFDKSLKHKLELARWYREFADHIGAGVSLIRALDILRQSGYSEDISDSTARLMDAIQSGSMMSEALQGVPALRTSQSVGMVRAGEIGGILDWTSQFLADWIEIENGQRELELAFWCRTFGSVLGAGAPAKLALDSTVDIVRDPELRNAARDLADAFDVRKALKPVLSRHAGVLLPIVRVAIMAGEKEGVLGYALQWAANAVHARMAERLLGREFQPPTASALWMKQSVEAFARGASAYLDSSDPEERAAAVTIVGRQRVADYVRLVPKLLADDTPSVRRAAICALADAGHAEASDQIISSLGDSDQSVRRAAIHTIATLRPRGAAESIAQLIADDDERVADTAEKTLDAMNETEVLTRRAIEVLSSRNPDHMGRAARILFEHPTPGAADVLIAALDDECEGVSHLSARALARMGRREAIPGLIRALEWPHAHYLQRVAAEQLAELGDPSAAPHIRKAIEEGRLDPAYAWTAEALEKLGG